MLKAYMRLVEFHADQREFHFSLAYDKTGKRTMMVTMTVNSVEGPPMLVRISPAILDSWGLDLTDWADNLEALSEHAMTAVDGVSEKD